MSKIELIIDLGTIFILYIAGFMLVMEGVFLATIGHAAISLGIVGSGLLIVVASLWALNNFFWDYFARGIGEDGFHGHSLMRHKPFTG